MGTEINPTGMTLSGNPSFSDSSIWTFDGAWIWTPDHALWPNRFDSAGAKVRQLTDIALNVEYSIFIDVWGLSGGNRDMRVHLGDDSFDFNFSSTTPLRFHFFLTSTAGTELSVEILTGNPGTDVKVDNFYLFGIPDGNDFYDMSVELGFVPQQVTQAEQTSPIGGDKTMRLANRSDSTRVNIRYNF